ncbi:response regulator transcription factor [Nonomuraea sp. MCN248]|uniref:Response regulator transcription factor n=1 Tax=Nonomuraea corallina TaxID=2989783 RepID=A0ABT4SF47_9ACTN|nr:response regulator transcription factor [Nonomuraea corallina]MDA0635841.1 response regulator transcription factor [Nonomuraea corallina]
MSVRVLVVDDQTVVREGLVLLLELVPGVQVVGTAGDGLQAVRKAAELLPDVVLMDLRMPHLDGVEATRRIRAAQPGTEVVMLSTYSDDELVFAALRAGARGYLTKDADAESLAQAVSGVALGQEPFPTRGSPRVRRRPSAPDAAADGPHPGPARALPDGLTQREGEVLELIAEGCSNAEVAARLFISEATVKSHINNLFAKIGVRDRAQAVTYAFRNGLAPRG